MGYHPKIEDFGHFKNLNFEKVPKLITFGEVARKKNKTNQKFFWEKNYVIVFKSNEVFGGIF